MKSKKRHNKKKEILKRKSIKRINNKKKKVTKKKKNNINNKTVQKKQNKFLNKSILLIVSVIIMNLLFIIGVNALRKNSNPPILLVDKVYLENDSIVVVDYKLDGYMESDKVYCLYTTSDILPSIDDQNWIISNNNRCEYELDNNVYYTYIKDKNKNIIKVNETTKIGTIKDLKINITKEYLALNDTLDLKLSYKKLGYVNENITWTTSNDKIASVKDGKVSPKTNGNVTISATIMDKTVTSDITITNLITKRPSGFDFKKKKLACNIYSKKENDLLDTILKFKVNKVGYKTRASVVEAARFLTLDFPYRINYFYENGRLSKNGVDGEGRYYHKGLYLDESKYNSIKKSTKSPKTWGCPLYSYPDKKKSRNGLDCSGFVSWAILNGGFNPGDIGAGITKVKDLTNLGTVKKITTSLAKGNTIKVGDLLHNTWAGGHIAIIVGIDKNYYYVAQAVWFDEVGVIINKYKKNNLKDKFDKVVLMDKYYKKDGNLTNMW